MADTAMTVLGEAAMTVVGESSQEGDVRNAYTSSLSFDGQRVGVFGPPAAPLFKAEEVCMCLGIKGYRRATAGMEDYERSSMMFHDTNGHAQTHTMVTEAGIYTLIGKSRASAAKLFKKWVNTEVLPTIRKTGSYSVGLKRKREEDESQDRALKMQERYTAIRERTVKCIQTEMEIMRSLGPLEDRAVVFYRSQMTQLAPLVYPAITAPT